MPPLCAPTPPNLLSSSPTGNAPPAARAEQPRMRPEENPGDGDSERSRMVAALVTALSDAAATAAAVGAETEPGTDGRNDPARRDQLATQAYTSLCFDFPIVPTNALAALASAFRSIPLAFGSSAYPLSDRFASGLRYLVAVEVRNQTGSGAESSSSEIEPDKDGEDKRKKHILELFGRAFLLAPAARLALARNDDGASFRELLATYSLPLEDSEEPGETERDDPDRQSESAELISSTEEEREIYDDDSDWESLETFTPSFETPLVTNGKSSLSAAWPSLMSKLVNVSRSVPDEVFSSKLWDDLRLTDHILKALQALKCLDEKGVDVESAAALYAELLSEHLLLSWNTSSNEVSQVVSTLMQLAAASREDQKRSSSSKHSLRSMNWINLLLKAVAKVCNAVGRQHLQRKLSTQLPTPVESALVTKNTKDGPSPDFVRNLWQSIYSNLHLLQEQLSLVGKKPASVLHEFVSPLAQTSLAVVEIVAVASTQLEEVLWILCFVLRHPPGNVNLQVTLLEGGLFRTALQVFGNLGREPTMDSLHHFLLLSMASSSATAEFAAQVPSFTAALTAMELSNESLTDAYALVFRLLLRTVGKNSSTSRKVASFQEDSFRAREAEDFVAHIFDDIMKDVGNPSTSEHLANFLRKLNWVHRLLSLLEEASSCMSKSMFQLWQNGSPIDKSGSRLQAALGSLLVRLADTSRVPSPKTEGHEKDFEDSRNMTTSPSARDLEVDGSVTKHSPQNWKLKLPAHAHSDSKAVATERKVKELLPSMILQLKVLSGRSKGCRESKID